MSEREDEGPEVDVGSSKWRIMVKSETTLSEEMGEGGPAIAPPLAVVTLEILSWTPGGTRITLPLAPENWSRSDLMAFLVAELERCRESFE